MGRRVDLVLAWRGRHHGDGHCPAPKLTPPGRLFRAFQKRRDSGHPGYPQSAISSHRPLAASWQLSRVSDVNGPNQVQVVNATDLPIWARFTLLAIVVDVWSRCIVGWAIDEQMVRAADRFRLVHHTEVAHLRLSHQNVGGVRRDWRGQYRHCEVVE